MIEQRVLVLNPGYKIRSDERRVLLYFKQVDVSLDETIDSFSGFIHPLFAVLFSLFDGLKSVETVAQEFTVITGLTKETVLAIITQLTENEAGKKISFAGRFFFFPRNTLIRVSKQLILPQYNPEDFLIPAESLDFESQRLYIPLDTTLILNNRCSTRCIYCYSDKSEVRHCTIPFPRLVEIIREASTLGMRTINISGGELFTYPSWRNLLQQLLDNGFTPYIPTKYPLSENHINDLKTIGIKKIQLSLDTIREHEMIQLLQVNKQYHKRILQTLEELDRQHFDININAQITAINQHSIIELLDYLCRFSGVKVVRLRPTGFSLYKNNYLEVRPDSIVLESLRNLVLNSRGKYRNAFKLIFFDYPKRHQYCTDSQHPISQKETNFEARPPCSGNFNAFNILPDGKVTICEELYYHPQFIIGDLMTHSIREIWNSEKALSLYRLSQRAFRTQSPCSHCSQFDRCRQKKGICWRDTLHAYGYDKWDYPDPRCPHAPEPEQPLWID